MTGKQTEGKPKLSLVPSEIIYAISAIREYGVKKYKDPENWKTVPIEEYHEALLRHTEAIRGNLYALDKESGMPHLWHIACNTAFIIEMAQSGKQVTATEDE